MLCLVQGWNALSIRAAGLDPQILKLKRKLPLAAVALL